MGHPCYLPHPLSYCPKTASSLILRLDSPVSVFSFDITVTVLPNCMRIFDTPIYTALVEQRMHS